jgi:hypothetical protein
VASAANIAVLPSRLEYTRLRHGLRALGSQEVPFIFPPFRAWDEPVEEWLSAGLAAPARPPPERMGHVTVSNVKTASQREGDVRVDRSSASPLQNPYPMRGAISRERVCVAAARLIEGPLATSDDAVATVSRDMCLPCAPGSDDPSAQRDRREAVEALAATGSPTGSTCGCSAGARLPGATQMISRGSFAPGLTPCGAHRPVSAESAEPLSIFIITYVVVVTLRASYPRHTATHRPIKGITSLPGWYNHPAGRPLREERHPRCEKEREVGV